MKKTEIIAMGMDFNLNYYTKYYARRTVTYKYGGKMRTREEGFTTDEGRQIRHLLDTQRVFKCPCCGRKVTFTELEWWLGTAQELAHNEVPCSSCYEDEMGEDL